MRCFIEIDIPESIKTYIEEKITAIKNRSSKHAFKPTKKENLHVTLAFLGEIDEKELEEATEKVSKTAEKSGVFECSLSKIEAVPEKFPRMIWVSLNECTELSELHNDLKKALMIKDEHGGFRAHVTAARIRPDRTVKTGIIINKNESELDALKFKVREIKIMQSILKNEGPEYRTIKSIALGNDK